MTNEDNKNKPNKAQLLTEKNYFFVKNFLNKREKKIAIEQNKFYEKLNKTIFKPQPSKFKKLFFELKDKKITYLEFQLRYFELYTSINKKFFDCLLLPVSLMQSFCANNYWYRHDNLYMKYIEENNTEEIEKILKRCVYVNYELDISNLIKSDTKRSFSVNGKFYEFNLEKDEPNFKETLLTYACKVGHYKMVKLLLKYGADLTFKNADNLTPLQISRLISKNPKIENLLLRYGADPTERELENGK